MSGTVNQGQHRMDQIVFSQKEAWRARRAGMGWLRRRSVPPAIDDDGTRLTAVRAEVRIFVDRPVLATDH